MTENPIPPIVDHPVEQLHDLVPNISVLGNASKFSPRAGR
jgi:hypothetical protein